MPQEAGLNVALSAKLDGLEANSRKAIKLVDGYGKTVSEVQQRVERLTGPTREAAKATRNVSNAARQASDRMEEAADATRRTGRMMQHAAGRSANFNQILYSGGDLIQDVQYGIRGAGNNVAFMAEQFADASTQAGGAMAALKGMGAALMGPAGLIVGLQGLLVAAPKIIEFFSRTEKKAKDAAKAIKEEMGEALEAVISFEGGTQYRIAPQNLGGAISETQTALQRARTSLQAYQERIDSTQETVRGLQKAQARASGAAFDALQKRIDALRETQRARRNEADRLQREVNANETLRDTLVEQNEAYQRQADMRRRLGELPGAERVTEGAAGATEEELSAVQEALQKLDTQIQEVRLQRFLGDLDALGAQQAKVKALKASFVAVARELGRGSTQAQALLDRIRQLEGRVANVRVVRSVQETQQKARSEGGGLSSYGVDPSGQLKNLNAANDRLQEQTDRQAAILAAARQNARREMRMLHSAVESGMMGVVDGFQNAVMQLAQGGGMGAAVSAILTPLADMAVSAGTIILTTGKAIEALKASLVAFFGGGAIVAGGALVGVGLAAKAGLSALASSSGGGGGGGSSRRQGPARYGGYTRPRGDSGFRNVRAELQETNQYLATAEEQRAEQNNRLAAVESATRESKAVTEAEARGQRRRAVQADQRATPSRYQEV